MSDEAKKDDIKIENNEAAPVKPKPEVQKVENAKQEPAAEKIAKIKKEKPTNCVSCNQSFKHKRWYYKNGKFFCSKRCWLKFSAEIKAKAAEEKTKKSETAPEQQTS
jgi:hypothetical protein